MQYPKQKVPPCGRETGKTLAVAIYSIKDLEKLSGIKAHTLRVWEQRYGIVEPRRTSSNIRYYDEEDLRQVLNIAMLNKHGIRISKIADMSREEIQQKVASLSEIDQQFATQLDALTLSVVEMDEAMFDRVVRTNVDQIGFERTMLEVIYPFLDKLSLLWLSGSISPVQEHYMSHLVRQKLIAAIEHEPFEPREDARKFLLYLPQGEKQELSLLFMQYLVKSRGHHAIYLGLDVAISDVVDAAKVSRPDYIFTMITETFTKTPLMPYIQSLQESIGESTLVLTGYQVFAQNIQAEKGMLIHNSLQDTIDFIEKIDTGDHSQMPSSSAGS